MWSAMQDRFQWSRFTVLRQRVTSVLGALVMMNWAVYLSLYTFEIQYSCEPLLGASTCIPCTDVEPPQNFWQKISPFSREESLPPCPDKSKTTRTNSRNHKDFNTSHDVPDTCPKCTSPGDSGGNGGITLDPETLIKSFATGSVIAVGAVIVGAPVAVAVGVGTVIWLATSKFLFSNL